MQKNSITRKYQNLVNQINSFEETLQTLTDNELRVRSVNLKRRYQKLKNYLKSLDLIHYLHLLYMD